MGSQEQLAKILKTARKKAGLTQEAVAERADISTNYYARIERGEVSPTVEVIDSLANALKIKVKFPLQKD